MTREASYWKLRARVFRRALEQSAARRVELGRELAVLREQLRSLRREEVRHGHA